MGFTLPRPLSPVSAESSAMYLVYRMLRLLEPRLHNTAHTSRRGGRRWWGYQGWMCVCYLFVSVLWAFEYMLYIANHCYTYMLQASLSVFILSASHLGIRSDLVSRGRLEWIQSRLALKTNSKRPASHFTVLHALTFIIFPFTQFSFADFSDNLKMI